MAESVKAAGEFVGDQAAPACDSAIDWIQLDGRYASRPAVVEELARVAIRTTSSVPAQLRRLAQLGRVDEIRRVAHSLRGGASVIGAHVVYTLGTRLDEACSKGDPAIEALTLSLADAVESMLAALEGRLLQRGGAGAGAGHREATSRP